MTTVYFVRHAQPDYRVADDRSRPLSAEGLCDRRLVLDKLGGEPISAVYASPYRRASDTVAPLAKALGLPIQTDERLRERECGVGGNVDGMFQKRWADFSFHEPGGESLSQVQGRNIVALFDILDANAGRTLAVGTHGTALSTIIHYFDHSFSCDSFLRIIDWMPYIIRLDFDGRALLRKAEVGYMYKEFRG